MSEETWAEGWENRVRETISSMGYEDAFSFVLQNRNIRINQLFSQLEAENQLIAFVQFIHVYYSDAFERNDFKVALMEAIARSMQLYLGNGWEKDKGNGAYSKQDEAFDECETPIGPINPPYDLVDWENLLINVKEAIERSVPPDDWCPEDHTDPILMKAFNECWESMDGCQR